MKKSIKYIVFCSLLSQLHALPYQNNFQVGLGYDCNSSKLISSPFATFEVITKPVKEKPIQKIIQIKNFNELLEELNIEKTFSSYKNKKIKKLLSNSHINDYTVTYLIYNKITNFKNYIDTKKQDCNLTYIDSMDIGGEYIALIHIKTLSSNDYKKIQKIKVSWDKINKFEKDIEKLSQNHMISFKNIITADDSIIVSNDITSLIHNAKSFQQDIKNHEVPYDIHIKNSSGKFSIRPYLDAKQAINNLEFIRRNPKQFSYEDNKSTPTIESKNISKQLKKVNKQTTQTIKRLVRQIIYPKRHNAYTDDLLTEIPTITLPSKTIKKRYQKIADDIDISVNYLFKIEVQNRGKVVLLKWTKIVKEADKLIHKEQNSKILFDSYINYKDLKTSHIVGNNIGTISFKTKFDSYEKNKYIHGEGIIESANCGYTIDKNATLDISCKDIKLKKLDIKFEHDE